MDKERIIQEFVPGKQVTLAHLIAHPGAELAKKIGVPESGAIGIMTLTPGETAMIAGDLAMEGRRRATSVFSTGLAARW
ncbi:putative carboxysome structural protein in ethanol utilization [Klebsiella pneumoniae]|nr:putative carboxysome structural protein in ethanol utilization [Klebsiella pneumoniae]